MRKILPFFFLLFSTFFIAQLVPPILWQKTTGGNGWDQGHSVWATTDGGSVIASYSPSTDGDVTGNHGNGDYWVAKLDIVGNIQWQKSLGGSNYEMPHEIIQTSDGGYIVVGESSSIDGDVTGHHDPAGTYSDYWVVKLNNTGNIEWQKSIGGGSMDIAYTIDQTLDGGYVIAGSSSSTDGDAIGHLPYNNTDLWVVKINGLGNIMWQKSFGGYNSEVAYSIKQTSDGGYIVAGSTSSNSGDVTIQYGEVDYWVLKLDSFGNLQWQKTFGGSGTDNAESVIQTSDGGYMVAGQSRSTNGMVNDHYGNAYTHDAWLLKLDTNGNIVWKKSIGGTGNDVTHYIKEMPFGGYVFAGYSSSNDGDATGNPTGSANFWVVRTNNTGNVLWQKSMGGSLADFGQSMSQTTDGGFVIVGYSYSNNGDVSFHYGNPTYPDVWVVKIGPEVLSTDEVEYEKFNTYPNPTTDKLFVSGISTDEKYVIYSLVGQKIQLGKTKNSSIDVHNLQTGTYILELKNVSLKFIKK